MTSPTSPDNSNPEDAAALSSELPPQARKSWLMRQVDGAYASVWLFLLSFAESSFFPIPPDLFMFPVVLRRPRRWASVAATVTLASVFGGIAGYAMGFLFFDLIGEPLVSFYRLEDELAAVSSLFHKNAFLAIFTAAFTPIPYKVFTVAAGLFHLNLVVFVAASLAGRGLRFFIVGYIVKFFGERMAGLVFRYFNTLTLLVGIAIIAVVALQFVQ